MKKLMFTLILFVGFTTIGFAQEANEIGITEGKEKLALSKESGAYSFTLSGKTADEIEASSTYYLNYFTVEFVESTQLVKIEMKENDARSRSVITRFLIASGVRHMNIEGKVISVNDFMMNYLQ